MDWLEGSLGDWLGTGRGELGQGGFPGLDLF